MRWLSELKLAEALAPGGASLPPLKPKTAQNRKGWKSFIGFIVLTIMVYAMISVFAYLWLASAKNVQPSVLEVLTLLKMTSLIILMMIGTMELAGAQNVRVYIRVGNFIIFGLIFLALSVLVAKLFGYSIEDAGPFTDIFKWAKANGDGVSIIPLIGYGVLNLGAALYERYHGGDQKVATHSSIYFAVTDLPCLLPLVSVYYLLGMLTASNTLANEQADLLFGGAMAMFIYISALLTVVAQLVLSRDHLHIPPPSPAANA